MGSSSLYRFYKESHRKHGVGNGSSPERSLHQYIKDLESALSAQIPTWSPGIHACHPGLFLLLKQEHCQNKGRHQAVGTWKRLVLPLTSSTVSGSDASASSPDNWGSRDCCRLEREHVHGKHFLCLMSFTKGNTSRGLKIRVTAWQDNSATSV